LVYFLATDFEIFDFLTGFGALFDFLTFFGVADFFATFLRDLDIDFFNFFS
jgi:hypothetical protein